MTYKILLGLVILILIPLALAEIVEPAFTFVEDGITNDCSQESDDYLFLNSTTSSFTGTGSNLAINHSVSEGAVIVYFIYNFTSLVENEPYIDINEVGANKFPYADTLTGNGGFIKWENAGSLVSSNMSPIINTNYNVTNYIDVGTKQVNYTITNDTTLKQEFNLGSRAGDLSDLGVITIGNSAGGQFGIIAMWEKVEGEACPGATPLNPPAGATPINYTNFTDPTYENSGEEFYLTFEHYNLTSSTTADLFYNNTYYSGSISHYNNSYVVFGVNLTTPLIYNNDTSINLNWNVSLQYANATSETDSTATETQTLYWNLTEYPRVNVTAYDLIGAAGISTFSLTDGSLNLSTTTNDIYFYKSSAGTYELTLNAGGAYEVKINNVTFTAGSLGTHTFNLYTHNSINFSFYDENLNTPIPINTEILVEFISDLYSYNYTTNGSSLYVDLLSPTTYNIRYQADGYGRIREYNLVLNNNTHNELILYLLNESDRTETTVTVYEQTTLSSVEGAVVYLQRYFQLENVYKTVAMYTSDISGKSYFDIEHDSELYKFVVDYPYLTQKLVTEPLYISETALNLYISLISDSTESFFEELSIGYTLDYDSVNNEFDLTYNDAGNTATEYCLYLKRWGQYAKITDNSSCSTANSGSISISGLTGNYTYYGVFTATIGGTETVIASIWKTIFQDKADFGTMGIFMTAILLMVFAFVGAMHIYSLIFVSVGLVLAQIMGLLPIGWGAVIVIIIASIILAMIIQMKK